MRESVSAFDSMLDLCRHQYRRVVLTMLVEEQRSMALEDLIRAVLTYKPQTSITAASEDVRTDIRLSLQHIHLPKLAAERLITNYPERQVIEPTDQLEQVQSIIATIIDADPILERPVEL